MMHWLYRYLFRGIGIVLIAGMITYLILAVHGQAQRSATHTASPAHSGASR